MFDHDSDDRREALHEAYLALYDEERVEHRLTLLDDGLERAVGALLGAHESGHQSPVVLVLDVRDPHARAIAEKSGRHEEIAALVSEVGHHGHAPLLSLGLPWRVAKGLLVDEFPEGRVFLGGVDPGAGGQAVVVLEEGYTIFDLGITESLLDHA